MLYYLDEKFYYTSPELIKRAYRVRINDYLVRKSYTYRDQLFSDDRENLLDKIIAGIQIPEIYKREAYVSIEWYLGPLSGYAGDTVHLCVWPLIENFHKDYDLFDKHLYDTHEDGVNTFFPSYDINHQGHFDSLEYEDIFKGATKTKRISTFLEEFGFTLPNQEKDIIIRVDEKRSFMVKSDSTMQSYYSMLGHGDSQKYYRFERVFAIINDSVYNIDYYGDRAKEKMSLSEKTFNKIAGGITNKEDRNRKKERVNDFVERYFSIPDDAVVYTIPELEECLAPEI